MGGDTGPNVTVPAGLKFLREHEDCHLIFVGREEVLTPILNKQGADCADRWRIQHASEEVAMDESPSAALRSKKDSSMRVAINLVKEEQAQACVSAGNTGALMATARFVLKTLPGIDRPAIITRFPTEVDKEVRMLDLGANVDSTPDHLYQFAVMGSILASAVDSIERPAVALLNIGEEEIKGNEVVKKAAELLSQSSAINYIGYVEGDDIFSGIADVIVCDGFIGNITLKACEGVAKLIRHLAKAAFTENMLTQLSALPAMPVFKKLTKHIDPRRRNGATFLGLNGIVIKSHGSADELAFTVAINEAFLEVKKNIPQQIRQMVEKVLQPSASAKTSEE